MAHSIVIADDDLSIHELWKQKFTEHGIDSAIIHIDTLRQFAGHLSIDSSAENDLVLFDYEFKGEAGNGLDAMVHFSPKARGILVTSRADEPDIMLRCEALGYKLLPKELIGILPIVSQS